MTISTVQITSNKWEDSLIESLENIEHSAMYLESALEEKQVETKFLLEIIKDLMKTHQKLNSSDDDLEYSYQELVKILQETGGKEIYTFIDFIQKLGLTVKISIDKT